MVESHEIAFWINQVLMQSFKDEAGSFSIISNYKNDGIDGNIKMDIQAGNKQFQILIIQK